VSMGRGSPRARNVAVLLCANMGDRYIYILSCVVSASLSFMDPLFLIIIDIFLYLRLFGWFVWKRIEYRFCDTLSL
jgi:hypothetical protein